MKRLYYRIKNGKIVDDLDLKTAYEIVTGKACEDNWHIDDNTCAFVFDFDPEYSKWLFNLLGTKVVEVYRETDLSVEKLIAEKKYLMAVKVYYGQHGCTLAEAKTAVSIMRENLRKE